MIIKNNVTGKTKQFAIEYDCLNWHRKWKDEKKNDMFVENDINVVRIQTFSQMPKPSTLWHFITEDLIPIIEGIMNQKNTKPHYYIV